jgi:predicted RND superfamily exporter protein
MRATNRHHWIGLLGWIADRPRGSAIAAIILLAVVGAFIRPPVIQGSMVDQLSGSNERLEIARRITAATGGETTIAIIFTPRAVSIAAVFEDLAILQGALSGVGERIVVRSVDAAADRLFAYDLERTDAIASLLHVMRLNPESTTIINQSAERFLAVISLPEELERAALEVVGRHAPDGLYSNVTVLASAQLEDDVAVGLGKDLRLLIPVIVAVTLLALYLAFGDWRALLLPLFASIASTVATFALFSSMAVTINLVTLIALPVVLIVGLANSCHFLAKSSAGTNEGGDSDAIVRSALQRVGPPFFFSTLTTAIALASLGFNELRPIANLGLMSAAALLIVFLLVLLAAPLLLRQHLSGAVGRRTESRFFGIVSRALAAWRAHISSALLLAMLGGAVCVPLLMVKSDPRAFIPDDATFSSALKLFEDEFYVFSPLRVLVDVGGDDRLLGLREAGAVREALSGHDGIRRVSMQPAVNSTTAYVLSALLADGAALGSVRLALDRHAAKKGVDLVYSNAALVYGDIDRQATESLLRSLGWSVALIFGAIVILFRSLRALLASLLANAVPLMLVCGVVWLIGNPLNLVTVFVFLVALGVIVDDSIHILFWRASGDAVSGSSIELSVLLSTLMLCLGLLLCQLSDFPTTRLFAAYCALALLGAVISNLTVLPLLLRQPLSKVTTKPGE